MEINKKAIKIHRLYLSLIDNKVALPYILSIFNVKFKLRELLLNI